jgi:Asp-tRNA(Asn)/Glu-tRNA(Gln) amidotransferase A subunit family amidase
MAANMVDLELAWRVMAQPDLLDADAKLFAEPVSIASLPAWKKVIGIFRPWFDRAELDVRNACQATIDWLVAKLGYTVVDISIPMIHEGQTAHAMTILCEIISGTSSFSRLTPANKLLMSVGSKTPGIDLLQAQKLRTVLMQHMAYLYETHPGMVIVTPTTPNAGNCFRPGDLTYGCSDGNMTLRSCEYVYLANFTGLPALSVPVAYLEPQAGTSGKIPIGLMAIGEWCSEDELIAFGYDCERYLGDVYENGRLKPQNFVDIIGLAKEGNQ